MVEYSGQVVAIKCREFCPCKLDTFHKSPNGLGSYIFKNQSKKKSVIISGDTSCLNVKVYSVVSISTFSNQFRIVTYNLGVDTKNHSFNDSHAESLSNLGYVFKLSKNSVNRTKKNC